MSLLLGLLCAAPAPAVANEIYQATARFDTPVTFARTTLVDDGGLVVAGALQSATRGVDEGFLLRIERFGTVRWAREYGVGASRFAVARPTTDGGYVLAGRTAGVGAGGFDALLLKVDANGAPVFARTFGTAFDDEAVDVQELPGGGFIVVGSANVIPGNFQQGSVYALRLDPTGGIVWERLYGASPAFRAESVIPTFDGGFAIGAQAPGNWLFLKLTPDGAIATASTARSTAAEAVRLRQMIGLRDGGYAFVGTVTQGGRDRVALAQATNTGLFTSWRAYEVASGTADARGLGVREKDDGTFLLLAETPGGGTIMETSLDGTPLRSEQIRLHPEGEFRLDTAPCALMAAAGVQGGSVALLSFDDPLQLCDITPAFLTEFRTLIVLDHPVFLPIVTQTFTFPAVVTSQVVFPTLFKDCTFKSALDCSGSAPDAGTSTALTAGSAYPAPCGCSGAGASGTIAALVALFARRRRV